MVDLKAAGIDSLSELGNFGHAFSGTEGYSPESFYVNGSALNYARWPDTNDGDMYLHITDVEDYNTSGSTAIYTDETNRSSLWDESAVEDLWIGGFPSYAYSDGGYKVDEIGKNTVSVFKVGRNKFKKNQGKFYFFNLPEEISVPGEYYVDRDNMVLYYYAFADAENSDLVMGQMKDHILNITGNNITVKDIDIVYNAGRMISITGNSNVIDGCKIAHASNRVGYIKGKNNTIRNCNIYDAGQGGIEVDFGTGVKDFNNVIENNVIHSLHRIRKSYAPSISAMAMGTKILNNEIYDSPSSVSGLANEVLIQNNIFHDVVQDAGDMSAIYYGQSTLRGPGVHIKNNYFYDVGNDYGGYGQQAIFADDDAIGPNVEGNIFHRTRTDNPNALPSGFPYKTYNGVYSNLHNNIFIGFSNNVATFQTTDSNMYEGTMAGNWWYATMLKRESPNYYGDSYINPLLTEEYIGRYMGTQWQELVDGTLGTAQNQDDVDSALRALERAFTIFKNRAVKDTGTDDEFEEEGYYTPSYGSSSSGGGFYTDLTSTPALETESEFVFTDMANHWAKTDVMNMYKAGIVSGVSTTTFEPDRQITRAEFATLVAKALKLENAESNFSDVNAGDWFAPYVGAAAKAGIIAGSNGAFRPNDNITREEMAIIVVKAYEYMGKIAGAAELVFADNDDISDWAEGYVAKAVGAGLISGMGEGKFAPKANATRAQSASLMARILK